MWMLSVCWRILLRRRVVVLTLFLAVLIYVVGRNWQKHPNHHPSLEELSAAFESPSRHQTCVHPQLELWNDNLKSLFASPPPLTCKDGEEDWIYVENGTFHINPHADSIHGHVTCNYTPIRRGSDDFQVLLGEPIRPMKDGMKVTSDAFRVSCVADDGQTYSKIHSAIVVNQKVIERSAKLSSLLPSSSLNLNILIFGFDSVSRMTWMRNLPKSYEFLVNRLKAVVFTGYNVVGDGTPQALLPMLTGQTEPELPEARRGFPNAKTVDGHPWIWKELRDVGYVTQWAEESPHIGTFTYRMLGFREQPVDHYMRTYFLAAEPKYGLHKPFCVGSMPRHVNLMRWMRDFVDAYPSQRRFSFVFHSEYSHSANNRLQWADSDLVDMLRYMDERGHLNSSLLILMSDHGARFQNVRVTEQGKYEERLPFLAVRVPHWFKSQFPRAARNLHSNAGRLTTPFDLHETFLDVIDFGRQHRRSASEAKNRKSKRYPRGFSLFDAIPADRSCADADIEPHWCSCLAWTKVPLDLKEVHKAAEHVILAINDLTSSRDTVCARLSLQNVTAAVRYSPGVDLLHFKQSSDMHGRVADLTDNMTATQTFYQVMLLTHPSGALYEATVMHLFDNSTSGKFVVDTRDISRINRYGSQPHCVASELPHLRPYCYCKVAT